MACALDIGKEVGPESIRNGITAEKLLSYCDNGSTHLLEINAVTNKLVIELAGFKDLHPDCSFKTLCEWLKDLFGVKWPKDEAPTSQAILKSLERLRAQLRNLKKGYTSAQKDQLIAEFLQQDFILPKLGFNNGHRVPAKTARRRPELSQAVEYSELKKKIYSINRNANKKLKHREAVIEQQKVRIHSQAQVLKDYEKKLVKATSQ